MTPEHADDRRAKRQSRVSREIVSVEGQALDSVPKSLQISSTSTDTALVATPSRSWQEKLLAQLSRPLMVSGPSTPGSYSSSHFDTPGAGPSSIPSTSAEPSRTRRKVDMSYTSNESPIFPTKEELYVMPDDQREYSLWPPDSFSTNCRFR